MTPEALIAFNLALIAAWAAPGPAMLVAVQETLRGGRRNGLAAGLGLATISPLWTLAALLGLDALFAAFPWGYATLRILGAAYLIWIAVDTWRNARAPLPPAPAAATGRAWRRGVLVNASNPKSVFFAAAVLVVIFPPDLSLGQAMLVAANHFVLEVSLYAVLVFALSTPAAARAYLGARGIVDRLAAIVMAGLAGRLLIDTSR